MTLRFRPSEKILFIGDSITSACNDISPPLGTGFVLFMDLLMAARYPQLGCQLINRGVGGDTVKDLERRWEEDAIAVDPDWLFVMIGVNDFAYHYHDDWKPRAVSAQTYRETYNKLINRARSALKSKIVLVEPTAFWCDAQEPIHQDMMDACKIVADIAKEHDAEVCPLHDRFKQTLAQAPEGGWMDDHVHPSARGHAVIALILLEYMGW